MSFLKQWGQFMMMGARAHAKWEIDVSNTILGDRKRMILLALRLLPLMLFSVGTSQFAIARPGLLVINAARGGIVDEADLLEALQSAHDRAVDLYQEAIALFQRAGNTASEMRTCDLLATAQPGKNR